jgi:hypothetical protein
MVKITNMALMDASKCNCSWDKTLLSEKEKYNHVPFRKSTNNLTNRTNALLIPNHCVVSGTLKLCLKCQEQI